MSSHYEATVERAQCAPLVLAVQDTSTFNYSGHAAAQGLVDLGDADGLRTCLAFDTVTAVHVFDFQRLAR